MKSFLPNTKVFSSLFVRKDKKKVLKNIDETHDFVDTSNIIEDHLGRKKLHLNKKGNSLLVQSILKYLRDSF